MAGQNIYVERDAVEVDEDEFLWSDIEGQMLVDSNSVEVGEIVIVHNQGASDLVKIKSEEFGFLDIPLVETYFDMSFEGDQIKLVVPMDTFDGLWSKK